MPAWRLAAYAPRPATTGRVEINALDKETFRFEIAHCETTLIAFRNAAFGLTNQNPIA